MDQDSMQEPKIDLYLKEILNTMSDGLMVVSPDGHHSHGQ